MASGSRPAGDRPRHPYALWSVVLGVVGLIPCFAPVAPWAWAWGNRGVAAIDRGGHRWSGRGMAATGRALGMVGTALLIFWALLMLILYVVLR